jgi:hypothetical protein
VQCAQILPDELTGRDTAVLHGRLHVSNARFGNENPASPPVPLRLGLHNSHTGDNDERDDD